MKSLLAGISVLVATACAAPQPSASRLHGDSGVRVPYDSDEIAQRALAAIPAPWRAMAELSTYGRSEEGRALHVLRIADPKATPPAGTARPAMAMTQAIHGNEFLDIANKLPAELAGRPAFQRFLARGGVLYVFPVVNPDGFTAWRRHNADDLDLNRDFPIARYVDDPDIPTASVSAENKAFSAYLAARFSPKTPADWSIPAADRSVHPWQKASDGREDLRVFFDYHCCQDPATGSLMPPWGDTPSLEEPDGIPANDVEAYVAYGALYKDVFPRDFFGTGLQAVGYIAKGTGDEFAYERASSVSLTYEGRSGGIEPERLQEHAALWEKILERAD